MPASLLSVNGKLEPLIIDATAEAKRSSGYTPIEIGKALQIRYLRFFLCFEDKEKSKELMISTHVKTTESKEAAAEAINYFDPAAKVDANNALALEDFGAANYGHRLLYYTKSYLGESIRLTTRVMELDRVDKDVVQAIQQGLATASSLPMFTQFLPYFAGASIAAGVFEKVVNLFDRDDEIVEGHDLDLYFGLNNSARLQSGRIVCIPAGKPEVFVESGKYELAADNRLVHSDSRKEYTDSSYFVLQVDAKKNKKLEKFDYFLQASELLKLTNRPGGGAELVETLVNLTKDANDVSSIRDIEEMWFEAEDDPEARKRVKAIHKTLSPEVRRLYDDRIRGLSE